MTKKFKNVIIYYNMPKKIEEKLKKQAKKKGLTGERFNAYVWGTLRKLGWRPNKKGD